MWAKWLFFILLLLMSITILYMVIGSLLIRFVYGLISANCSVCGLG